MRKPEAFIFDFNGVLFWDTHLHDSAWRQYSKKLRGTELTDEEMIHEVHGKTNKDVLEYLTGSPLDEEMLEYHIESKESMYRKLCLDNKDEFKLAPGAIEFLNYIKQQEVKRTIATSSEIGNVKFFFQYLDLAEWFDFDLVAYDDGEVPGKPEPDLYLIAAQKLSVNPADSLVVEDSRSGVASAHNAGIGTIVAIGPKETHKELSALPGVALTILDFYELLNKYKNL